MNYSDSERIASVLENAGLHLAGNVKDADVIIFNTCSVRQSAEDRIFGLKKNIITLKKKRHIQYTKYNIPITVLTGCMAQRSTRLKAEGTRQERKYLSDLKRKVSWVDIILPIQEIHKLPKLLTIQPFNHLSIMKQDKRYLSIPPMFSSPYKASVPISTGCNEFCTYCIVPYARGELVNRPAEEIISEVKNLVDKGCKDIMLLGQNVNAYNCTMRPLAASKSQETCNFLSLLKTIDSIEGNFWLTFLSSHPNYFDDELIDYFAFSCKMRSQTASKRSITSIRSGDRILQSCHIRPYLNIALQSGSNKILKSMNRKYDVEKFIDICTRLKKKVPNLMLSTDIIVGFPDETEKDFEETAKVMEMLEFDMAYINKYSPRGGTAAARIKDNVPWQTKKRRAEKLNELLRKTALKNNKKYLDTEVTVLIDKIDKKKNVAYGKTFNFKDIRIPLDDEIKVGEFVSAKVTKTKVWSLEGRVS
jgi:tRNA-2-methylthio-N6-dimethylallyladenosine synthase